MPVDPQPENPDLRMQLTSKPTSASERQGKLEPADPENFSKRGTLETDRTGVGSPHMTHVSQLFIDFFIQRRSPRILYGVAGLL